MGCTVGVLARGLPNRTSLLNPMSADRPILGAVPIPLAELPDRLHELPDRTKTVYVVGEGEEVDGALSFLRAGGRSVEKAEKWEYGEQQEILRLWQPNEFLLVALEQLDAGIGVDIGCGAGREAVTMAAFGWSVRAFDWDEEALLRGRDLAKRYSPEVADEILWQERNVEADEFEVPTADLITTFRFLHRPLIPKMRDALKPGGSLIIETFTTLHRAKHNKPQSDDFVLTPGELLRFRGDFDVVHYSEDWRGEAHTARMWIRKP